MRNLLLFFTRYSSFFLFLFLEAVSFFFIVRYHSYQKSHFINSANAVTGKVYGTYDNFTTYMQLNTINDSLHHENARLRNRQLAYYERYDQLPDTICSIAMDQQYAFIPAKVINNSVNSLNNYITLNQGKNHGIKREMGVVNAEGIVGIVKSTSGNFSSVMSLLHKDSKVSAKLKQNGYIGTLQWEGGSPYFVDLVGIPSHVRLQEGDSVVTSGYSSIFPENIPVGVIEEFENPKGDNFYKVKVSLSAKFQALHHVYVVNYYFKEEREQLEAGNE